MLKIFVSSGILEQWWHGQRNRGADGPFYANREMHGRKFLTTPQNIDSSVLLLKRILQCCFRQKRLDSGVERCVATRCRH